MMSEKEKEIKIISKEEFISLEISSIFITVKKWKSKSFLSTTYQVELYINASSTLSYEVYADKTSDDFEKMYDMLISKFKNISLPEFPTQFQIFDREKTRMNFFDLLLNKILLFAKNNPDTYQTFLTVIYNFVIESTLKEQPKNIKIISPISNENINKFFVFDSNSQSTKDSKERKNSIISNSSIEEDKSTFFESSINFEREKDKKYYDWNDILIRINKEATFKGYIKINEQCLFIYRSISVSNFLMVVPLYKINFDIYRLDYSKNRSKYINPKEIYEVFYHVEPTTLEKLLLSDFNSEIMIRLYHPYDHFELFLKFTRNKKLISIKNFLSVLENNSYSGLNSQFISSIEETNLNIYGKLCIELSSLSIPDYNGQCFVKVTLQPYSFDSKLMINTTNFQINQLFHLPIHNRFGSLTFEVFNVVSEGILVKTNSQEIMFEYKIELPEILNNYFFPSEFIEIEMNKPIQKNKSPLLSKLKEAKLTLSIKNYSNPIALTTKNRNKKVLEDMRLDDSDDDLNFKNLMKRMKKMIIVYRDFNHYYKTLFRFKYPIFSGLLMILSIIFCLNFEARYLLSHTILLLLIILFCYSKVYNVYFSFYVNTYILSLRNPYDFESIFVSTKKEEEQKEVKNPNYLIEKENTGIISNIIDPIKHYKEYKEQYFSVLFTLTNWVSTCEKIKNLFLWTDPLLSFYFMMFMICIYLFIYHLEIKYILLFSFVKKFISGFFYYRAKFLNNCEIGKIILESSLEEWRAISNNKFESENSNISSIKIYDEKFKQLIKDNLEKHSNLVIKEEFFNSIETLGNIQAEIGKCKDMIKLNKNSTIYHFTNTNSNIYKKPIEPEDIFYYFVSNIKSDFYIMRHSLIKEDKDNLNISRFASLSNADFPSTPKKSHEDKKQ